VSEHTAISWTDATFNPWWGCQKVSPACDHCFAERDAKRFAAGRVLWGAGSERRTFDVTTDAGAKHWKAPLNWAKRAFVQCSACGWRGMHTKLRHTGGDHECPSCGSKAWHGARIRVFCASMADWLDLDAPLDEFVRLLDTIRRTPELDWLLLTKRIGNWRKRLEAVYALRVITADDAARFKWLQAWIAGKAPENVWMGATIINQEEADRDVPKLLALPARVRFLSIEPMLGPIDLRFHIFSEPPGNWRTRNGKRQMECKRPVDGGLHWVIAGGESGPHARPMHPDWVRPLRDQCAAAGVPFHFKQWGEHTPGELATNPAYPDDTASAWRVDQTGRRWHDLLESLKPREEWAPVKFARPGKKAAGRLLDGVEHNGFP
jgi:protein gp37